MDNDHNRPLAFLADEIGRVDAIAKGAAEELHALKEEFRSRGVQSAAGDSYLVTATEQVAFRLDQKKVREFLGDQAGRFETVQTTTVIRIKPNARTMSIAA